MSRLQNLKQNNKLVYSRTEKEKTPSMRGGLYAFLLLALLTGLGYLILGTNALEIREVRVEGYKYPETIINLVNEKKGEWVLSKNILFFNKTKLKEAILGDSAIKDIKIKKILPGKLVIIIEESNPKMIWVTAGEKWLVDDRGVVTEKTDRDDLPEVYDASNIKIGGGGRVASPTFIKFIYDINTGFETVTGTKISKITIFDLITDVHILSSDGWTVYFNASKSAEAQLKNLQRVLGEARQTKKRIEYIDMRLDNRIFYK